MIDLTLKSFQDNAIQYLLDTVQDPNKKKKIIVKSPTGSGKTITLIGFIERFLETNDNTIICWLTPGKGDLEEQSRDKMIRFTRGLVSADLQDALRNGFEANTTYFINWETITKKGNTALKEGEKANLLDRIATAHKQGLDFMIVIDEEHQNNTSKANAIIEAMAAAHEIRVSATPERVQTAEYYEVPEEEVIAEELITKALYINNGVHDVSLQFQEAETELLVDRAVEMRDNISKAYADEGEDVNPLVLIQFPSLSDKLIERVERHLESKGYTYENKMVASWFSAENRKDKEMNSKKLGKINVGDIDGEDSITKNNAQPRFLLFKQALATGWDCPRAKILVKLRDNMNETFEIQTLGRLRRMPKARHYGRDILDCAYLYTFDSAYKEQVIKSGSGYEVQRLFLKDKAKTLQLVKEYESDDSKTVDMKQARKLLYEFFMKYYNLDPAQKNRDKFQKVLEAHGYIFGTKLHKSFLTGRYSTLKEVAHATKMEDYQVEVNTHQHGIELQHAIGQFRKPLFLDYKGTTQLMKTLFQQYFNPYSYKVLALPLREYYAFIINNMEKLKEVFYAFEECTTVEAQYSDTLNLGKEEPFIIPREEVYPYIPGKDNKVLETNAYDDYNFNMTVSPLRSTSERLFEMYCNAMPHIKYCYKNGDAGKAYLSLRYETALKKGRLFYPDYIVETVDGTVWIIETKGGETAGGADKNIDIECEKKLLALSQYAFRHGVKYGFVRDKNQVLYINDTPNWAESLDDSVWKPISQILK